MKILQKYMNTFRNKIYINDRDIKIKGVSRPGFEYLYVNLNAMINETIIMDINNIKLWGFNTVRIPLRDYHWFHTPDYQKYVNYFINEILQNKMFVILDLHTQQLNPYQTNFLLKSNNNDDSLAFWIDISNQSCLLPVQLIKFRWILHSY
jgi:aryl-phospho-beta-D-glucosidase BglC (GH1 family)